MAVSIRRKSFLWTAIPFLFAVLAVAVALWQVSRARCFQLIGEITCRVDTGEKIVALTFDDGPTAEGVDALLPVLQAHGARATFFLIGHDLEKSPGLARRIVAAGHEIANHSYSHDRMAGLLPQPYADEIERTSALLRAEGAEGPMLFRPPYGKKLTGLPIAVERAGARTITWDVEDPESPGTDAAAYAAHILGQVRPGSIILMHPMYRSGETARAALPGILAQLGGRGYRIVTVGELLAKAAR
jgi:peptidoglycan/xylan/chitin deacetylase (PgdA/CDA1 family)